MLNVYSNFKFHTKEGKKLENGRIFYWQRYYKAKTSTKVQ